MWIVELEITHQRMSCKVDMTVASLITLEVLSVVNLFLVRVGVSGGTLKGACIAYGNEEQRIHNFEVLVIEPDKIVRVDFDVDHGKLLHSTPKVTAEQLLDNDSSDDQSMEFSYNEHS